MKNNKVVAHKVTKQSQEEVDQAYLGAQGNHLQHEEHTKYLGFKGEVEFYGLWKFGGLEKLGCIS